MPHTPPMHSPPTYDCHITLTCHVIRRIVANNPDAAARLVYAQLEAYPGQFVVGDVRIVSRQVEAMEVNHE